MSKPNLQEATQLQSLIRQLQRLSKSTDTLYRRMAINGRAPKYCRAAEKAALALKDLAGQVDQELRDLT